jgi:hypothetical protein
MENALLTFLARTTQNDARDFTKHIVPKQPAQILKYSYFSI